jgi:diguanylate cyclase (GGDEF)-like protein
VVAAWAVQARHAANLQEKLTQRARSLHTQIIADRQYYASVIVPRIEALGGSFSPDYHRVPGQFPLPATFVREVSALTAKVREGYTATLLSPWAINPTKRPQDQFQRDAFAYLTEHPSGQFVRTDTVEGRAVMRVLMADRASAQSCVACHNAHPQSPKHDFKLNDLMGGLEIVIPMEQYLADSRRDRDLTVAGGAGLCLLVMGILAAGTRRTVTRPLVGLADRMRGFAGREEGPSPNAVSALPGDEVAQLEKTFEGMVKEIASKENELQDANARLEQRVVERTQALQSLVEAARQLTADVHLEQLLQDTVEAARRLTGATYAALGVFDETETRLAQFFTSGVDEATRQAIGDLPTGRGLLGHTAKEAGVLRLRDLTQHPAFSGFPPHHPTMRSFLGVAIRAHGRLFGRLYVTEKQGADEFTESDADVIAGLAAHAGAAIETAQLFGEVQAAEERYRVTLASLPVAVVRVGKDRTIRFANRTFYELLHRRPEDTVGLPISAVLPVEELEELLRAFRGSGAPVEQEAECLMPACAAADRPSGLPAEAAQAGDRRVLRLTVSGIRRADDDDDDDDDIICVIEDYTERKAQAAALEYKATHDALTDLPNRFLFHDRLQQALRAGLREKKPLALLVMDLDRFKEINDTLGHLIGDRLLQEAGRRIRGVLRESDTVARLGGDEFALLLPGARVNDAVLVVEKVQKALARPFTLEGLSLDVEASFGIALFPEHGEDADTLIRRADVAMYVAKQAGSGYALYASEQDQYTPRRLMLIGELRHAIELNQLVLHYQPKINLRTGRVTGVEALVRWQHPQHGLIPPAEFISLAEQTGAIKPLTLWVLEEALRQCQAWHQAGLTLTVAVNLSARNLQDPQLVDQVAGFLETAGAAPSRLELEVTESVIMADPARALETLTRLSAMGVRLAIDDFGAGYSSLSYLKKLPVNELKIDKTFVINMATDDNDAVIVRSTIDLAHNLGLAVVAEGVETQASWNRLAALGCDAAQGYWMSRPLPAADLTRWLAELPFGVGKF